MRIQSRAGTKDSKNFFTMELVDKLVARGFDIFLYYATGILAQGTEDIFFKLWHMTSSRLIVQNGRILLDYADITESLLNHAVGTCNSTILNFLTEKGLPADYTEYPDLIEWIPIHNLPANAYEFTAALEPKTLYNERYWEGLMTEVIYGHEMGQDFFELIVNRT